MSRPADPRTDRPAAPPTPPPTVRPTDLPTPPPPSRAPAHPTDRPANPPTDRPANHPANHPTDRPGGIVRQLVLQATGFCNIDCAYCYLPDRSTRTLMTPEVVAATARALAASGRLGDELEVRWHAGEPLTAPRALYATANEILRETLDTELRFSVQTNGLLLDDAWCGFLAREGVRVGVSLDGPAIVHDAYRRTRAGGGTHARAMKGVARLAEAGIPFDVISVITPVTLAHRDAYLEFMAGLRPRSVGLNPEETEGGNVSTLHGSAGFGAGYRDFLRAVAAWSDGTGVPVRELVNMRDHVLVHDLPVGNTQCEPYAILTVGAGGDVASFSPSCWAGGAATTATSCSATCWRTASTWTASGRGSRGWRRRWRGAAATARGRASTSRCAGAGRPRTSGRSTARSPARTPRSARSPSRRSRTWCWTDSSPRDRRDAGDGARLVRGAGGADRRDRPLGSGRVTDRRARAVRDRGGRGRPGDADRRTVRRGRPRVRHVRDARARRVRRGRPGRGRAGPAVERRGGRRLPAVRPSAG
ncbi:radical SAM protein [Actinomadura sp. WMMB 499]|nr:radical SAM protein [Actinomadura sp. WMMB 499]